MSSSSKLKDKQPSLTARNEVINDLIKGSNFNDLRNKFENSADPVTSRYPNARGNRRIASSRPLPSKKVPINNFKPTMSCINSDHNSAVEVVPCPPPRKSRPKSLVSKLERRKPCDKNQLDQLDKRKTTICSKPISPKKPDFLSMKPNTHKVTFMESPPRIIKGKSNSPSDQNGKTPIRIDTSPKQPPPSIPPKPPRTFEHDIYKENKLSNFKTNPPIYALPIKLEDRYSCEPSDNEYDSCIEMKLPKLRRRSRSVPQVEPYMVTPIVSEDRNSKYQDQVNNQGAKNETSKELKELSVKGMILQSFEAIRRKAKQRPKSLEDLTVAASSDSGDDISIKDIEDRIIYAQSLKRIHSQLNSASSSTYGYSFTGDEFNVIKACIILQKDDQNKINLEKNDFKTIPQKMEPKMTSLVVRMITAGEDNFGFYWFSVLHEDQFVYSYCLNQKTRIVCYVSNFYFPELYYKLLKSTSVLNNVSSTDNKVDLDSNDNRELSENSLDDNCIRWLRKKTLPFPGEELVIPINANSYTIQVPFDGQLTSKKSPLLLLEAVGAKILIKIISTLINERRCVFISNSVEKLIETTTTTISFLYPLTWDYMFWPSVPLELIKRCAILETPYLIGIKADDFSSSNFLDQIERKKDSLLIVDIDKPAVIMNIGDETTILPSKSQKELEIGLALSFSLTDPKGNIRDAVISEAFIHMFVELIGSARFFVDSNGEFHKDTFISSSTSKGQRMFLKWFCETRLFDSYMRFWQLRRIQSEIGPMFSQKIGLFERKTQNLENQFKRNDRLRKTQPISRSLNIEKRMKKLGVKLKKVL